MPRPWGSAIHLSLLECKSFAFSNSFLPFPINLIISNYLLLIKKFRNYFCLGWEVIKKMLVIQNKNCNESLIQLYLKKFSRKVF